MPSASGLMASEGHGFALLYFHHPNYDGVLQNQFREHLLWLHGNSLHASLSFWMSPRSGFSSSLHVYKFRHQHLSLSLAPSAERNQHLGREIYASWTPILGWNKLFQLDKMNLLSITWISLWKSTLTMTFGIHLSLLLSTPQGLPQDLTHSPQQQ